jgi:hypothetical protein
MSTETTPREIPTDIAEYEKYVADGGNLSKKEHAPAAANTKTSDAPAKTDDETDPETEQQHQKKKSGFQRRVTRLNREIGERDAKIADLERRLGASGATKTVPDEGVKPAPVKAEPAKPAADKPKLEDFTTYEEYSEALIDWKTEAKLAARETQAAERAEATAEQNAGKAVMDAHNARVDEAKTRYDDWGTAFDGLNDKSFTDAMVVGIFESEFGPDISYALATNRDELARIAKLSPVRQAAEIGKIEARFQKEADADDDGEDDAPARKPERAEPAAKAKPRVTQAPAPAKPLKGKSGGEDAMPDPKDFAAYERWAKRKAAAASRN